MSAERDVSQRYRGRSPVTCHKHLTGTPKRSSRCHNLPVPKDFKPDVLASSPNDPIIVIHLSSIHEHHAAGQFASDHASEWACLKMSCPKISKCCPLEYLKSHKITINLGQYWQYPRKFNMATVLKMAHLYLIYLLKIVIFHSHVS